MKRSGSPSLAIACRGGILMVSARRLPREDVPPHRWGKRYNLAEAASSMERWIEHVLPEPYSHDRRTWIDNSTDPVSVWYVDHNGYLVRVQPLQ
jgi:hypothetical protein